MKHMLTFLTLCHIGVSGIAQDTMPVFSGAFTNVRLDSAILQIETDTDITFYYSESWLDTIYVSGSYDKALLNDVLDDLFKNTSLKFFKEPDAVIITRDIAIIERPAITQYFEERPEQPEVQTGLIFKRDYQEIVPSAQPKIIEIGNRNQLKPGGNATVAGYIREKDNQKPLEGVTVYLEKPRIGGISDENGFYSLVMPVGKHKIHVQSVGLKSTYRNIVLFSDGKLDIAMDVDVLSLKEVVIESERDANIVNAQMGVESFDVESVKNVPLVLGERDILKIATTLPGVQTAGEGAAGLNVRGGKADQNLMTLNNATVYNPSHFFGFFSVFNADAIEGVDIYKSGIPARYGGRLSSVFDINAKEVAKDKFSGGGGISPVTSRLTLEIPLVKEKSGLMIGGRSTYSDWVFDLIDDDALNTTEATFHDVIGRLDFDIGKNDKITATGYYSYDLQSLPVDTLDSQADFSYTNANLSLTWQHHFNENLSGSLSYALVRYDYGIAFSEINAQNFQVDYTVNESMASADFSYHKNDINKVNFGFVTKKYDLNPGRRAPLGEESLVGFQEVDPESGRENALYFSNEYQPNEQFTLYAGLRYSLYTAFGPASVFTYTEGAPKNDFTRLDTLSYSNGKVIETYHGPEFRLSGRYALSGTSSVKLGYNRTRQYQHMLINAASLAPTDTWRLSGAHLRPQIADQWAAGYFRNFSDSKYETSFEVYYKRLQNMIDFKVGADFLLNETVETDLLQGDGKAYGMELSVKKSSGWFSGYANYTFSRTFFRFDSSHPEEIINNGQYFPASFDRPHNLNLVTNYKFTKRYSLSVNAVYNSGRLITVPVGNWSFRDVETPFFDERNQFRIPDYFRIDVGINIEGSHKIKKLAHSFWTISVYNLLGRDNIYSVFFRSEEGRLNSYQVSVFPTPVPTITYNFSF